MTRRWLYPRARAVVVQTDAGATWACSIVAADRIRVIPNAVLPPTPVTRTARDARASTQREILAVG
ncbi:MAG: glycosyltransferase family 4 protein, partial [Actinobacteria bacterium]|nr:glycosyltransferase family 4 protein [Actinomycetota bacterium]NIU64132.1 glycosyltransferase family 4 protein [Actinomycetota bacterium]NIV85497.1 glycosyltransferase family 4 protein [Actinomycetota bacterium]NIW25933.1 glycosyltransferase family 4 protein [Actinomycetota bacterium]NIX18522.1 glycosyltransferase family 4 protein [Actinomycetota bacterium]